MHYQVSAASLQGVLCLPPSKSQTLRAVLFAALAHGESSISGVLQSPDTQAMAQACHLLGASVDFDGADINIRGTGGIIAHAEDVIDAGNSGIVLRFCAAVGALGSHPVVITGDHSIRYQRPMQPLLSGLRQLGVCAKSMRGDELAPIIIQGPIQPGVVRLCGKDSQPVSALLIAAALAQGSTDIHVDHPGEKPWIGMTLEWLTRLGVRYTNQDFSHYRVDGPTRYEGFSYTVPGDLSSAAFPLAAALITSSEITITNINLEERHGDRKLFCLLEQMGCTWDIGDNSLHIKGKQTFYGSDLDINDCIDFLPALAVIACFAQTPTRIYNGQIARHKESDRIHCIATELRKMGALIEETPDGLYITPSPLHGSEVNSQNDHRIAMALTIAGLASPGITTVHNTACVRKSFPDFVSCFQKLGASIEELS